MLHLLFEISQHASSLMWRGFPLKQVQSITSVSDTNSKLLNCLSSLSASLTLISYNPWCHIQPSLNSNWLLCHTQRTRPQTIIHRDRYIDRHRCTMLLCSTWLLSRVQLFVTPRTVARQAPLSMGILQARILDWVVMPSSRGSFQSRDWAEVSCIPGGFFTTWATREAQEYCNGKPIPSPGVLPDPGINRDLLYTDICFPSWKSKITTTVSFPECLLLFASKTTNDVEIVPQ